MAEQEAGNGGATSENQTGVQFAIQRLYLKDVSFESPGAPQIFTEQAQPQLQLNMSQNVNALGDDNYEVVLALTLTCNAGEKTVYLVEVKQAGVFLVRGLDDRGRDYVLGSQCPTILYPYARQAVSDLIQGGGFPPFHLQPLNFEALYQEQLRRRAGQQQAGAAPAADAGNA